MDASVFSTFAASDLAVGATVGGCIVLAVIMFLSDDRRKPIIALFSRNVFNFTVPLLIVFAYLGVIWAAKILAG